MTRKTITVLGLGTVLAGLVFLPSAARAQDGFEAGDFEFTLGAGGANDRDFDGTSWNGNASLGYFFTDNLELSVRQSLTYTDIGNFSDPDDEDEGDTDGSALSGSTRVALDFHFDLGRFQPFIGANVGYVYGDSVSDTFEAAPEAGVKFFVNDTTFIYGLAEYQFFFDESDDADDAFGDGQFVYTVGIGFTFGNNK